MNFSIKPDQVPFFIMRVICHNSQIILYMYFFLCRLIFKANIADPDEMPHVSSGSSVFAKVHIQGFLVLQRISTGHQLEDFFFCLILYVPSTQSFSYVGTGLPGLNQY